MDMMLNYMKYGIIGIGIGIEIEIGIDIGMLHTSMLKQTNGIIWIWCNADYNMDMA